MVLRGKQLLLRVDDNGSRYPVVIDPWIRQAELTYADRKSDTYAGYSVAISGNTIVVGAPSLSRDLNGAAYVFVEPTSGWTNITQTTKLVAWEEFPKNNYFGFSVAIDGNTIVVGGSGAYVFVKPANGWPAKMDATTKLALSDGTNGLGGAVSISGDTVLAGDSGVNSEQGAAYVFVEPASGWPREMTQTAELTASDGQA
jgi:uncharacterized protein (DUF2345 family)